MPALRFLPERTDFFVSFRAAATNAADAARLLTDLVTGQEPADQVVVRLRDLEHRGDEITHEIFTALARNLIAPLDYEDIRALARQLDDVTDAIDDVGQRLALYHLLPATEVAHRLTRIIQAQAESLAAAVALIEHGKHREALERHVAEIHRLETEADAVVHEGLAGLYDGVTTIPGFVSAMRWGELYGLLEDATDRAETVANTVQGIMEQQV
jgi:predicted phosphate transport protein (TIGR00153 family)